MPCPILPEDLAAYAAGETDAERLPELEGHLQACPICRQRLQQLHKADELLAALPPLQPAPGAVAQASARLEECFQQVDPPQIMTLPEVAAFLRISPQELAEIAADLPAFELAGQIRVRRERLLQWIAQREQAYLRQLWASEFSRSQTPGLSLRP